MSDKGDSTYIEYDAEVDDRIIITSEDEDDAKPSDFFKTNQAEQSKNTSKNENMESKKASLDI